MLPCIMHVITRSKSIVESFKGSGVLVTQAKNSLQTPSLATQLLKLKTSMNAWLISET